MNCLLLFSPAKLKLAAAKDFHYLNQSGCIQVPKINDAEEFEKIRVFDLYSFFRHHLKLFLTFPMSLGCHEGAQVRELRACHL